MGGDKRSTTERARELLQQAIHRVGLDAVRRSIRPKRASRVPSDEWPADRPPELRRCSGCHGQVIEGANARMDDRTMLCWSCDHPSHLAARHDLPPAA